MSLLLAHVGKCTDPIGLSIGYPHTYIDGGHAVAWTGSIDIIIGLISQCWTFIFDNHVVHDNTCVHDISDAVNIPHP